MVLKFIGRDKYRQPIVLTVCDCGEIAERNLYQLKSGAVKGCAKCNAKDNITHGFTDHPLYRIWHGIKQRCTNDNSSAFVNYKGRGIQMCEEWLNDPEAFIGFALAAGWVKGLQIDRIDNSSGYSPDNCRCVTAQVNCSNTRKNKYCELDGVKMTFSEASVKLGRSRNYLSNMVTDNRPQCKPANVVFL